MIIRRDQTGRVVADRAALAAHTGLSELTVRRRCRSFIVGPDPATKAVLYDALPAAEALEKVVPRRRRRVDKPPLTALDHP